MKKFLATLALLFASVASAQTGLAVYNQYSPKWFTPGGQYSGINAQTGTSYTPVLADANLWVTLNNASPITVTIPANASVAYPVGTTLNFESLGAGSTTFALAGGVTLNRYWSNSNFPTLTQFGSISFIKTASDAWRVYGAANGAPIFNSLVVTGLTGYVKGNGNSALTASATIPYSDITGGPSVTPAALTVGNDTNVTLTLGGTPATSLLQASSVTAGWSGTLAVSRGGSGAGSLTGYVKGNGTSAFTASATIPYSDLTGTPTVPATTNTQIFSTAGAATWNKPAGAIVVEVYGCGSGGQGGGGQGASAATARGGGGGGGGGAYGYRQFFAAALPSSVSITVGAGGTGAGGGSSGGAGSSPGGNGNPSSFGSFLSMAGGGGGGGTAAGAGGTPGLAGVVTAANAPNSAAGTAGATGGKGVATAAPATTPLDSWNSAPGGGGGAGATTGNVAEAASNGGGNGTTDAVGAAGTSSSTAPTDGGGGTHTSGANWPGTGGGGGGAGLSTLAGKNGGAGIFCSGGGGGGAGSAAAGGNGGNGGDGYVTVVTYF